MDQDRIFCWPRQCRYLLHLAFLHGRPRVLEKQERLLMTLNRRNIILISIVAIVGSLLYFYYNPSYSNFFPRCIFHSLTNLDCPGCGSQRAIHALLNGNVLAAADYNLLVILFLPFLGYSAIAAIANAFFHRSWNQNIFYSPAFVKIVLLVVLLFWILRNIPLGPFSWLSAER